MAFFEVNNHRLFYSEKGFGKALLFIGDNGSSYTTFNSDMSYFSRDYHGMGIDLPGNGNSEPFPVNPPNFWQATAKEIVELCKKLNFFRANVIGVGGGAIVALHLAVENPKLATCVVADSIPGLKMSQQDLARTIQMRKKIAQENEDKYIYLHGEEWKEIIKNDNQMQFDFLKKTGGDYFKGCLKNIKTPVLLTGSLDDETLPNLEVRMGQVARNIPDAQMVLMAGGKNPFCVSKNLEFRKIAHDFIKENGVKAATC